MKYIAVFDIPDDCAIGCAVAKVCQKGKERYKPEDYQNAYANVEPLASENAEVYEKYETVNRVIGHLGLSNAYDMPSFWYNNGRDYKVIDTKYHKGYMQALQDVEHEIRKSFGFADRDGAVVPTNPFMFEEETE